MISAKKFDTTIVRSYIHPVTLKCVKDSFSPKGVLFLRKGLLLWLKVFIRIMFDI